MASITLNPGFVLILAALAALASPKSVRPPLMAGAAAFALWLLLDNEFGAATAVAQMGLSVVLLDLDALNRVFGIAYLIALVLLAIYSSARRSRFEDAAILLLAGGAVSALFVGDLISFVASASLAGFAAAWVVFASPVPGANGAGVRLLIWHGLEGLLFLVGVAFHISSGAENSVFARLSLNTLGGGFIFAALMIRVGAPMAHVWLKDSVSHASSAGAVALSIFTSMLGVYALARLFPAEPLLPAIGGAMIILGIVFAAAEDDLRRAASYGLIAQVGVCVALIGVGSPLARAGAEAHAFALVFAFSLLLMAHGAVLARTGVSRISALGGLARRMPMTTAFVLLGGLAAAGLPGFAAYVSMAVALEATGVWDHRVLWTLIVAATPALAACLALRPVLAAYGGAAETPAVQPAVFPMLLGMGLAAFFCVAVGLNPAWLYRLTPTELAFAPYTLDRLAPALETVGIGALVFLVLRTMGLTAREHAARLLDVDALYRGPIAGAGRWIGVVLLRLYGAWQTGLDRMAAHGARVFARAAQACDRPYADKLAGAMQLIATAAILVIIMLFSN